MISKTKLFVRLHISFRFPHARLDYFFDAFKFTCKRGKVAISLGRKPRRHFSIMLYGSLVGIAQFMSFYKVDFQWNFIKRNSKCVACLK